MALHLGRADLFGDGQRLLCKPLGCSQGLLGIEALEHAGELLVGAMAHVLLQIHTARTHQGWVQPVKRQRVRLENLIKASVQGGSCRKPLSTLAQPLYFLQSAMHCEMVKEGNRYIPGKIEGGNWPTMKGESWGRTDSKGGQECPQKQLFPPLSYEQPLNKPLGQLGLE